MTHNTLENYYKTLFSLTYHFKMPVDFENLIPFERDLYVAMIKDHQEKVKEAELQRQNQIAAMRRAHG